MKIKVSQTTNTQLDWLVAKCEGFNAEALVQLATKAPGKNYGCFLTNYSTDWSQGGPIIGREGIELHGSMIDASNCWAQFYRPRLTFDGRAKHYHRQEGPTPLIAAMRCFVASKLGVEVEVPDELA